MAFVVVANARGYCEFGKFDMRRPSGPRPKVAQNTSLLLERWFTIDLKIHESPWREAGSVDPE